MAVGRGAGNDRLKRAETGPTAVASGRTGVRANADVVLLLAVGSVARTSAAAPMRSSSRRGLDKRRIADFLGLAHPSGMPAARKASMMRSRCFK